MNPIDDNLEMRIVRSLDDELADDQRLELDRELIRNPDAHRLRDEYAAVDRLAAAALLGYVDAPISMPCLPERRPIARSRLWSRWSHVWLAVSGAIAAAILAMVVPSPMGNVPLNPRVQNHDSMSSSGTSFVQPFIQPVSTTPVLQRATGRDLMGVVGEDGNIYWIEVERTRTIRLPNGRLGLKGNEL